MPDRFNEFVHIGNVRSYHRQLAEICSPERRKVLMVLLAEESAAAKKAGWVPLYK
jgi:hypothetical protein